MRFCPQVWSKAVTPSSTPRRSRPNWSSVAEAASIAEIRRAFRTLALATHPDRGGEAAAFMRIKWAYDEALGRREGKRLAILARPLPAAVH
mgnify:CR=1 FL=1